MESEPIQKEPVWTTDKIRQECENWTLGADAELLKHLQQFSQKLLLETHTALKSLDVLESQLNTTYVKFSTVSNNFLSLSDTQFVENRVYEDEEISDSTVSSKEPDKSVKSGEDVLIDRLKEAINNGFKVLNDKFETIKVPKSDSEDDEDDNSQESEVVLKPVNPYEDLVLPYLIGSAEFNSDDKVGVGDLSSEDEIEEALSESDKVSESEDSEPETNPAKVQEPAKNSDLEDIFKYNQTNSVNQMPQCLKDSSQQNVFNPTGQKTIVPTENKIIKDITSEIRVAENNSNNQSVASSSSSNEFIGSSTVQDDPGTLFTGNDEADNLFQADSSLRPQKVPAGGISVLRPGVQLPIARSTPQQPLDRTKHSNQKSNIENESSEDDEHTSNLFGKTSSVLTQKSGDYNNEDYDSLFPQTKSDKTSTTDNDDIFYDSHSNKTSELKPDNNSSMRKSFWLDSRVIDDSDNIFDSKGIFSDEDDDDLFSTNKKIPAVDKKSTVPEKSKQANIFNQPSVRQDDKSDLFSENDTFFTNKSSPSGANFFDTLSGATNREKFSKNISTNKDNLFDDLFDDVNDEDDLFKDILPSKSDITSKQKLADVTIQKKSEVIKPVFEDNNHNVTLSKEGENIKSFDKIDKNETASKQAKNINPSVKIGDHNVAIANKSDNVKQLDKIKDQNASILTQAENIKPPVKVDTKKLNNPNLKSEVKTLSILDSEDDNDDDLFASYSNNNFSKFKTDDLFKKGEKLFDDASGSDDDLFSISKSLGANTPSTEVDVSQEKKLPEKNLFSSDNDFKQSRKYNENLFEFVENDFEDKDLFSGTTNAKQPGSIEPATTKSPNESIDVFRNDNEKQSHKDNANLFESVENDFEDKDLFSKTTNVKQPGSIESVTTKPPNDSMDLFRSDIEKQSHKGNSSLFESVENDFEDKDLFSKTTNVKQPGSIESITTKSPNDSIDLFSNDKEFKQSQHDNENKLDWVEDKNLFGKTINVIQPDSVEPITTKLPDNSVLDNTTITRKSVFHIKKTMPKILPKPSIESKNADFSSENQSKIFSGVISPVQDDSDGSVFSSSRKPGKLSAELTKNIDPTTLLPGSRPKFIKQEDLPSSDTVSTLQSVVKERPKIQVKRRPPSRRARQEAIRASRLEDDDDSSTSDITTSTLEPSFNLSPSTDEDDLFTNTSLSSDKITSTSHIVETRNEPSRTDLLSNKPSSTKEDCRNSDSLLSSSDPDFNLFSDEEYRTQEPIKSSISTTQTKPRNIFDEDSDDDLFNAFSTKQKKLIAKPEQVKTAEKLLISKFSDSADSLLTESVTSASSSQSPTKTKISPVQSALVTQSKTTNPLKKQDILGEDEDITGTSLFSSSREGKLNQVPKKNFLFDDEDGDIDIFSQNINVTSSQPKQKTTNVKGPLTKTSGHSTQKVKLSSQQVFTDPLMSMQND